MRRRNGGGIEEERASLRCARRLRGLPLRQAQLRLHQASCRCGQYVHQPLYRELLTRRRKLTGCQPKVEFLRMIHDNQILILVAETGSRKTTQNWMHQHFGILAGQYGVYLTDGILLIDAMKDPLLEKYMVIVHERTLAGDALFGCLKEVQEMTPNLKPVVMSSIFEAEKFQPYFSGCSIDKAEGSLTLSNLIEGRRSDWNRKYCGHKHL
ncbi:hypothetical protein PR202_ga28335 [Eleusine coracana subsp. coracana]|uniref:RNA helicase n=1 Tax=Eleusine coracana subsp. coracana TaxID=191504 RepID=A0AAV5DJ83_ELECO|nr:hypothetical protein PR202_ga28335 [Eleusine coracana subsp. coracana]